MTLHANQATERRFHSCSKSCIAFPVFYGETFKAHLASDRQWYIPVIDVCDALGIDPGAQRKRIQRDQAISRVMMTGLGVNV